MKKLIFPILASCIFSISSVYCVSQTAETRELCEKAQELEKTLDKLEADAEEIDQKEKTVTPIIRNVYEILSRCFTILFDMQRFSNLLVLTPVNVDKNDFVKCSIVIKNFASYFKSISAQLKKIETQIAKLKENVQKNQKTFNAEKGKYEKLCGDAESAARILARKRGENIIQNDVIYHLAAKSESLDELDAELEAEGAIGVLKNAKASAVLVIKYPVVGKIVSEFGDKGQNNEMIYYISFETRPRAVVTSPAKGLVVFAGKFRDYGNMLIISNGDYRVFLYGMDVLFPSTGDTLEIGDYVGRMKEKSENRPVIKMELKKSGEPLDPRQWMTVKKTEKA
ncbi:MAG: peptidoglycan DD-metalloendopeptidase family protein [Holosporaceae bacterium]|jgi:septal ring factor EnvC (AmiA/AmiB activator)|nr:peptidoglycan DD-metalloendopeptidase family protein [Holosporaceae bacterium]